MKMRSLVTFAGVTLIIVIAFLTFNLIQSSPCDTIFEQTASELQAKIQLVEAESELSIGKEKIQDLTEAAQLTALNLKTCCIVLDSGQLDSNEFLQCKDSARQVEAQIDSLRTQLEEVKNARKAGDTVMVEEKIQEINKTVKDAKDISLALQEDVATLEKRAPTKTSPGKTASSREQEPNDDLFTPNEIALDTWIAGSIDPTTGPDHFKFTTPQTYSDIIDIELKNETANAKPRIGVYHSNKEWQGGTTEYGHKVTAGQNQAYSFSSDPDTVYYLSITYLDANAGEYRVKVSPSRAYDSMEPNDDIRHARKIELQGVVEANFTDHRDTDYYRIKMSSSEGEVKVLFENLSTEVKPRIGVYDENKVWLGGTTQYGHKVTAGQNQSFAFSAKANTVYYIYIENLSKIPGSYELSFETP